LKLTQGRGDGAWRLSVEDEDEFGGHRC
jgi:hypothetical protein